MFPIIVVEKIKTHILCSITFFFFFENRAVYEIMRKNTECTFAFPRQQWSHEQATKSRYTYTACIVYLFKALSTPVFDPRLVHLVFLVDEVTVGNVFFFPLNYFFLSLNTAPLLHIHL
jgi:hypothetical protein